MILLALLLQTLRAPSAECRAPSPECRVAELRGLGRSERAAAVPRIAPFLKDPNPIIEAEAIWALAQVAKDSAARDTVVALLSALGARHSVLGAVARGLGRVAMTDRGRAGKVAALFEGWLGETVSPGTLVEVVRGAESFVRVNGRVAGLGASALDRLEGLARYGNSADPAAAARVRRAAVTTLTRAGRRSAVVAGKALNDADAEVRRLAVLWVAGPPEMAERRELLVGALADAEPMVRFEALRAYGRSLQKGDCGPVLLATRDRSTPVALEALDLLGSPCPDSLGAADMLGPIVDSLAASPRNRLESLASWHRGAHAVVALAKIAPARAATVMSRLAADPTWQVRVYTARAAAILGDVDRLVQLAADPEDNVRTAAIAGLLKIRGHAADSILRVQLARQDYQLVLTAAQLLEGGARSAPRRRRAAGLAPPDQRRGPGELAGSPGGLARSVG